MRRNETASCMALGGIVLLTALLALRFDLASLWLSEVPTNQRAAAPKRVSAAAPLIRPTNPPSSSFDVVLIDPEGSSVFAGRAPANASVTVFANDTAVATTKANEDGQWAAVIDHRFASGEYKLSLMAKPGEAGLPLSGQSVNITIASNAPRAPAQTPAEATAKAKAAAPSQLAAAPAPITFPYDDASVTAAARKQAAALGEFLRQRQIEAVTLSGHADSRGSDAYNMQLSRHRLESVARYLRASGYAGKLVLVPKGKSEPFVGADREKLSQEDAFQLDRRVELLRSAQ